MKKAGAADGGACENGGGAGLPRAVTRGESPQQGEAAGKAKVDWLNCTFDPPQLSIEGLVEMLGCLLGCPTVSKLEGGIFGFEERHRIRCYVEGVMVEVGCIARGGIAQRGRWMLQLTGKACGMVKDWEAMQDFIEGFPECKVTRIDLAVDFTDGEHTVDDAVAMVEAGQFTGNGRKPSTTVAGDWLEGIKGRTLYVGSASNGKLLRVYEKGKQLGDMESDWVRFEVQFGNRDRVIPFDAMTKCDQFFAGAYPALQTLLDAAAESIPTTRTEAKVTLGHLLHHLRRSFGKVAHQVLEMTGCTHTELIEEIRVIGIPRRLKPSGVVAGAEWDSVQSQARSYRS